MYRRYAIKFHKKQKEFVNCVNMVEREKKARSIPGGIEHLGIKRYVISTNDLGGKEYYSVKDCA